MIETLDKDTKRWCCDILGCNECVVTFRARAEGWQTVTIDPGAPNPACVKCVCPAHPGPFAIGLMELAPGRPLELPTKDGILKLLEESHVRSFTKARH